MLFFPFVAILPLDASPKYATALLVVLWPVGMAVLFWYLRRRS
jgi:hypothetical protein